jgi:hypothetical protein
MENPMNNDAQFTEKRLASLREPNNFTLSTVQARITLDGRLAGTRGRWVWKAALASAVFLFLFAIPAARAIAQTGSLSFDSFFQSLHRTFLGVHQVVFHLYGLVLDLFEN